ncbi:MAG: LamG-like jellyroll fold domain-containing protein [Myxococcota bacterium]
MSCLRANVDLEHRSCDEGDCANGYACNPLTSECAPQLSIGCDGSGVCPLDLRDGDACEHVGSFVPCVSGTTGCESGCRLCDDENTWSECSCTGVGCDCVRSNGGVEVCDGFDNDCRGGRDDGVDVEGCLPSWIDGDGDGFGVGASACYCGLAPGRATLGGDTDDGNPNVNPDTNEVCDGRDSDGDGMISPREFDYDGDGYVECEPWVGDTVGVAGGGDCNDFDDGIFPGAPELCDGVENACTGLSPGETDLDGDGYVACVGWSGITPGVVAGGDCAPGDPNRSPGRLEIYDGLDNDCDAKADECLVDCDCDGGLVSCYQLESLPSVGDEGPAGVGFQVNNGSGSIAPGIDGNGYLFDGSYVLEASDNTAHDLTRFSVSAWLRIDSEPGGGGQRRFVWDVQSQYSMWQEDHGDLVCAFANSSSVIEAVAGGALDVGALVHVACTYDGSALRVYVGGDLVKSQNTTTTPRTDYSGKFHIGSNSPDATSSEPEHLIGLVDHLKVYDQALGSIRMCVEARRTDCESL